MKETGSGIQPVRLRLLWGPWQLVVLVLIVPWLLVVVPPGDEVLNLGDRWLLAFIGGLAILILLAVSGRTFILVGKRGLWVAGRGWTGWEAVVSVRIEEIDERILSIEAPVLRLDVSPGSKGLGSREQLTGLAGYRFGRGNRRVWRQANLICGWAGLPPLPFQEGRPPEATPRRAKPG